MGNSRRKAPIIGITAAPSDQAFKRAEHGRERTAVRGALAAGGEPPHAKLYGDPRNGAKDGKPHVLHRPDLLRK